MLTRNCTKCNYLSMTFSMSVYLCKCRGIYNLCPNVKFISVQLTSQQFPYTHPPWPTNAGACDNYFLYVHFGVRAYRPNQQRNAEKKMVHDLVLLAFSTVIYFFPHDGCSDGIGR